MFVNPVPRTSCIFKPANILFQLQELHQALSYNSTNQLYTFQNIRYAQPPVGDLRFRAPAQPKTNRTAIQTGSELRFCPQGVPVWQGDAFEPIGEYSNPANPYSLQVWETSIQDGQPLPVDWNKGASEDCLFLDVHVTKKTLQKAGEKACGDEGSPVLVWVSLIHPCLSPKCEQLS